MILIINSNDYSDMKLVHFTSLSALTDENEYNPERKLDPNEYFYLHLFGENLEDSDDSDGIDKFADELTSPPTELLKKKLKISK